MTFEEYRAVHYAMTVYEHVVFVELAKGDPTTERIVERVITEFERTDRQIGEDED